VGGINWRFSTEIAVYLRKLVAIGNRSIRVGSYDLQWPGN